MRTPTRHGPSAPACVLVLAVLALAATVLARPPHAPPLYDGIGFPDEPYRWVVTPPGHYRTPVAAMDAVVHVPISGGANLVGRALSGEQGPQVAVGVPAGAFAVPAGVSSITLRAVPQAVPAVVPDHGQVVSNLYVLTAEASGRPVPLAPGHAVLVNLRAERATAQAVVICRWTGRQWEQLPTVRIGVDVYAAQLDVIAPVAVVRLDPGVAASAGALSGKSGASSGVSGQGAGGAASPMSAGAGAGPGADVLWLVIGMIVVVLTGGVLLVRRRAGEAGSEAAIPGGGDEG